jgi:N-acetylglucosaminyldiphosphoundecaprenol N-acetyl-beta-D-mannosaminyltransferase
MDKNKSARLRICGVPIDCLTTEKAVEIIAEHIRDKTKTMVFTPNSNHLVGAQSDSEFKRIYAEVDLSLVDGMPLVWLSLIYGKKLPERINGTNLVWKLCELSEENGFSLFFVGTNESVMCLAVAKIREKYPRIRIGGYCSLPYDATFDAELASAAVERINIAKPDILLVAFGPPKQEKWIYKYYKSLNTSIFVGIGGSLDFISGRIQRAPKWMQDSGLEWLFRLCQEPRRLWKRYLIGNLFFLYLVLKEIAKNRFLIIRKRDNIF